MVKQTNVSLFPALKVEAAPKVYVPVDSFNRLLSKYISIADYLSLKENFNPLVSSVGWIMEDLVSAVQTPKAFSSTLESYITSEGNGLLSFTLPNRSGYRHIRRGLYQVCRQLDDWNRSHKQIEAKASIFARDCESQDITYIILTIGPVNPSVLSALQYDEISTREKEHNIIRVI